MYGPIRKKRSKEFHIFHYLCCWYEEKPVLKMKRVIYIFTLITALAFNACINDDIPQRAEKVNVGDVLPDFSAQMSDGTMVTGESLRQAVAVVVFFHTSCPDCRQLLPQIQTLYDEYSSKGVAFALISREEDSTTISTFWEEHDLTMPYSPQSDRAIYNLFANSLIPRVYVSDKKGVVQSVFTDNPVPSHDEIKDVLDELL